MAQPFVAPTTIGWMALSGAVLLTVFEKLANRRLLKTCADVGSYQAGFSAGAILVMLIQPSIYRMPDPKTIVALICSGVLWYVGNSLSFRADQKVALAYTTVASQVQILFTVLGGVWIFSESLSVMHAFAFVMIISGIGIGIPAKFESRDGIGLKFISTISKSAALVLDKKLTLVLPPTMIAGSAFLLPLVMGVSPARSSGHGAYAYARSVHFSNVIVGGASAMGYVLLIHALARLPMTVVSPLYQINYLVVLIISKFFSGDGQQAKRVFIGGGIASVGCLLMAYAKVG